MADKRQKDVNWRVADDAGNVASWDQAQVAVLMDIRDELKALNQQMRILSCPNFLQIPHTLKRISRNTAKKRKPRAVGKPKLRVVR